MSEIKFIEVKSEIAAGTRGASLGIDALKIASIDLGSSFFRYYSAVEVKTINDILFTETTTPKAKYIEQVFEVENNVCVEVANAVLNGDFPFILAGDHSTAAGTIAGIKKANNNSRIGVIWIDAHADLHTPYTTPSGNMHGMPLAMVAAIDNLENKINNPTSTTIAYWNKLKTIGGEGAKIALEDVVFVAARDLETPELSLLKKHNIRNFETEELREKGVQFVADEAIKKLANCDIIYVSFDVDSMDSEISMGTGTPVPGGITVNEAIELNSLLVSNKKVCAWEIVEVNPTLDTENLMAENALKVMESVRAVLEARL